MGGYTIELSGLDIVTLRITAGGLGSHTGMSTRTITASTCSSVLVVIGLLSTTIYDTTGMVAILIIGMATAQSLVK